MTTPLERVRDWIWRLREIDSKPGALASRGWTTDQVDDLEAVLDMAERIDRLADTERRLRSALELARNRLQLAAVNAIAAGDKSRWDYSDWADEAHAVLLVGGSQNNGLGE